MIVQPLEDYVTLELVPEEDTTKGGITVPASAQGKGKNYIKARVLAVGSKVENGVKVGDTIIVGKRIGMEVDEGGKVLVLRAPNIMAKLVDG
jgi:co-chaperonin GroES (HSP10)